MNSSIYVGRVGHARFAPRAHRFRYSVMMFLLDLDELGSLANTVPRLRLEGTVLDTDRPRRLANALPGRFTVRRSDFLPTYDGSLAEAARAMYRDLTGEEAPGRVTMLANLRSLGWNFNPITLFFFYDAQACVCAIAEVTNTPWNERHLYVLGPPGTTTFAKAHHVSPFLEMAGTYRLTYTPPEERFTLAMTLHDPGAHDELGPRRLSATLQLERRALDKRSLAQVSRRRPDGALRVSVRIYLQAARLFAKRIAYVPPPASSKGHDRAIGSRHHRP